MEKPLVSVLIANYNYAQYLEECLESVLNQTYKNYEVIMSDNRSTDESYEIMGAYRDKFLSKGIWCDILQNKRNIGSGGNTAVCFHRSEGKYVIWLSSDDNLEPTALEKMVAAMEKFPTAGCVQVHRNEVDENGRVEETAPFYSKSCFIKGEDQAAVYMMAGIAVSSQTLFRKATYTQMLDGKHLRFQVAGDWYDNFMMACYGDVVYINEPLVNYRVHSGNETSVSEDNLIGILEHYQLINAFKTIADSYGMTKPQKRYEEAVKKLSKMCLRYAKRMLINDKATIAMKYLYISCAFDENIKVCEEYRLLMECITSDNPKESALQIVDGDTFVRTKSYDPPEGSIDI